MQTPSPYPDVPVSIAREVFEGEGVAVEVGPLGDWWMQKGDVGMPLPIGPGHMPAMAVCFACKRFLLSLDNFYVKVAQLAAEQIKAHKRADPRG